MNRHFVLMILMAAFFGTFVWFTGCATSVPPYHHDDSGRMGIIIARSQGPVQSEWQELVQR